MGSCCCFRGAYLAPQCRAAGTPRVAVPTESIAMVPSVSPLGAPTTRNHEAVGQGGPVQVREACPAPRRDLRGIYPTAINRRPSRDQPAIGPIIGRSSRLRGPWGGFAGPGRVSRKAEAGLSCQELAAGTEGPRPPDPHERPAGRAFIPEHPAGLGATPGKGDASRQHHRVPHPRLRIGRDAEATVSGFADPEAAPAEGVGFRQAGPLGDPNQAGTQVSGPPEGEGGGASALVRIDRPIRGRTSRGWRPAFRPFAGPWVLSRPPVRFPGPGDPRFEFVHQLFGPDILALPHAADKSQRLVQRPELVLGQQGPSGGRTGSGPASRGLVWRF